MNLPIGLWRKAALFSFSFIFIYVGIDHFLNPEFYLSIMPPILPFHLAAVLVSGFFESTRRVETVPSVADSKFLVGGDSLRGFLKHR